MSKKTEQAKKHEKPEPKIEIRPGVPTNPYGFPDPAYLEEWHRKHNGKGK